MIQQSEAIGRLTEPLESLRQGKGGLLHISGPSGVGKTTFLNALKTQAGGAFAWAQGRGDARVQTAPFGHLTDLIRKLWGIAEGDSSDAIRKKVEEPVRAARGSAANHSTALFRLFNVESANHNGPSSAEASGPGQDLTAGLPQEEFKAVTPRALRVDVSRQLEEAIIGSCRRRPAIMVLDDADEADAFTISILEALLPRLSGVPLLIVLASENSLRADLLRVLARAAQELKSQFFEIRLAGLPRAQASELFDELLKGASIEPQIKDLILDQANGNPLYLTEMASHFRRASGAFETHPSEVQLLNSPEAVLSARAEALEGDARAVLQAASVIGFEFGQDLLEAVAIGISAFRAAVKALLEGGFLLVSIEEPQRLRLRHPLLGQVVYLHIAPDVRSRLHGRSARALERMFPEKAPLLFEHLAYHYEAAREDAVAAHYLKLAGDRAWSFGAFVEAMRFYDHGAGLCEGKGGLLQERLTFLARRGDLWESSGNYSKALVDWTAVRDLARENKNRVEEARADFRIGLIQRRLGHLDESILYHEKAQELFREQKLREGQAWNLCDMGMTNHVHGEYKKALRQFREAYKAFQEISHRDGMAWCLYHMGMAYRELRQFGQALKVLEDAQRIFRELGHRSGVASSAHDLSLCYREIDMPMVALDFARTATQAFEELELAPQLAWSYDNLSVIYRNLTNREQALVYAKKAREIFERIGLADGLAWNLAGLGTTYLEMRNGEEAEKSFSEAYELFRRLGNDQGMNWCQFSLGLVARYKPDFDKAEKHLGQALSGFRSGDLRDRVGWCLLNLAAVHRHRGQYSQAMKINQRSLRLFSPLKMKDGVAWSLFQMGNICKDQGKFLRGWQLHREALKLHQDVLNKQGMAWGHNELGVAYYELDDPSRAEESFKSALELGREIEEVSVIAEATLNMGMLHLDRGDLAGAEDRFNQALKMGCDLGATRELARMAILEGDFVKARTSMDSLEEWVERRGLVHLRSGVLNLAGELAYAQGDSVKARALWQQSGQWSRRLGQKKAYLDAILALGQLDAEDPKGDLKAVLKTVLRVHKFLRSLGSRRLKVKALIVQGLALMRQDPPASESCLKQALRLLETLNLPALEMRLLRELTVYYRSVGQEKDAQQFRARLMEASKRWNSRTGASVDADVLSDAPRLLLAP